MVIVIKILSSWGLIPNHLLLIAKVCKKNSIIMNIVYYSLYPEDLLSSLLVAIVGVCDMM